MKICTLCNTEKPYSEFHRQSGSKDGYCGWCKPCKSEKKKAEYEKNKDKHLAKSAKYRAEFPEKVSATKKRCYANKIDQYRDHNRQYYHDNRDKMLKQVEQYRAANKDAIRIRDNDYRRKNRSALAIKQKNYQRENSEKIKSYVRGYRKNRRQVDKVFALRENMRARFKFELAKRGETKTSKENDYLGCTWLQLRDHLEAAFLQGMTWDNYGEWQVDHIVPLATAKNKEELLTLCHFSNLQPLWAFDNASKGAKILEKPIGYIAPHKADVSYV